MAIAQQVDRVRSSEVLGQLIRFGLTGGLLTVLYSAIYWVVATYGHVILNLGHRSLWPLVGVVVAFGICVLIGNVAHSRFSFRGHGSRDRRTAHRFLVVQLIGFGLNAAFTWLITGPMHGPTWWPLIPSVFVVPLLTFWLNRVWAFA